LLLNIIIIITHQSFFKDPLKGTLRGRTTSGQSHNDPFLPVTVLLWHTWN